jgi:hypothetical protein
MSLLEPSRPEQRLADAVEALVDLRTRRAHSNDPAEGSGWGADRTVRAEFLRELLTGGAGKR